MYPVFESFLLERAVKSMVKKSMLSTELGNMLGFDVLAITWEKEDFVSFIFQPIILYTFKR